MTFDALDWGLIGGALFYFAFCVWLLQGVYLSRRHREKPSLPKPETQPSVSVIIAARQEGAQIETCLSALAAQDYAGSFEVTIVDDRSTDDTAAIVTAQMEGWPHKNGLQLIEAPSPPLHAGPKKNALAGGIAASHGELLMFTDADCQPPTGWISAMVSSFAESGADLVAGFADRDAPGFLQRCLRVDDLGMGALAEGGIGHGVALSCTGRSLAYRRALYDEVGGFEAIGELIGGDDVYFLRHVAASSTAKLAYCAKPQAVVREVRGHQSGSAIFWQKLRHASKASRYEGAARVLGVVVFAYHLLLAVGLSAVVLGREWELFAVVWGTRWLLDILLLAYFAPRSEDRRSLWYLPVAEFLYIPYVVLFVPLARIFGFRWRDAPSVLLNSPSLPLKN